MTVTEQIQKAADHLKKTRPLYLEIIEFYASVFQAQEDSKKDLDPAPVPMDPHDLAARRENHLPLTAPSRFTVQIPSSSRLLAKICGIARDKAPLLSKTARCLLGAVEGDTGFSKDLFSAVLADDTAALDDLSRQLSVSRNEMVMLAYLGMKPSIQLCAEQWETYRDGSVQDTQGGCPICGSAPDLAILDDQGRRRLKCHFCQHTWEVKRMGCVFCGDRNNDHQQYFFSDPEKEYRVDLCDACHSYIKVVDLRQMDRSFYAPLELVSTLHLDMQARRKGYSNHVSDHPA